MQQVDGVVWVPLDQIVASPQDRQNFDQAKLERLGYSICTKGQRTAILVRPHPLSDEQSVFYELIAGERRTRASRIATAKVQAGEWLASEKFRPGFIQAKIEVLSDDDRLDDMLIENVARENLNPMEESDAYQSRLTAGKADGRTEKELAGLLGQTVKHIREMVRLQRLCPEAQDLLRAGQIDLKLAQMMVGGAEKEGLDHNRQRIVLKFIARAGKVPPTLFMNFIAELKQAQDNEAQMDFMVGFWADQVTDDGDKFLTKGERVNFPFPVDERLPEPVWDGRNVRNMSRIIYDWIERLQKDEFAAEAAVVARLYRYLIHQYLVELPRPSALKAWNEAASREK